MGLRACEAVHLEDADFEVPAGAERRVVERGTAVRLAEPYVFVHPYRLAISENRHNFMRTNPNFIILWTCMFISLMGLLSIQFHICNMLHMPQ